MIGRASRKQVETLFGQLVRRLGPVAKGWSLEWISEYGGFVVTSDNGGGRPLGHRRRSAAEMRDAIGFALDLLWHDWRGSIAASRAASPADAGCSCVAEGGAQ